MPRKKSDTVQLSKIRMREALRASLAREAEAKRTTLNAVIIGRLEKSLMADARMVEYREYLEAEWGHDVFNLALSASKAIGMIERSTGKRWVEDDRAFELFTKALVKLASNYRDLVMRNYSKGERSRPRTLDPESIEEQVELIADLSGISPPYPRNYDVETAAADRKDSLKHWRKKISKSRPLDSEENQE